MSFSVNLVIWDSPTNPLDPTEDLRAAGIEVHTIKELAAGGCLPQTKITIILVCPHSNSQAKELERLLKELGGKNSLAVVLCVKPPGYIWSASENAIEEIVNTLLAYKIVTHLVRQAEISERCDQNSTALEIEAAVHDEVYHICAQIIMPQDDSEGASWSFPIWPRLSKLYVQLPEAKKPNKITKIFDALLVNGHFRR